MTTTLIQLLGIGVVAFLITFIVLGALACLVLRQLYRAAERDMQQIKVNSEAEFEVELVLLLQRADLVGLDAQNQRVKNLNHLNQHLDTRLKLH